MRELREELDQAVERLDRHYAELQNAARLQLGSLFNPADYPASLEGMFAVSWDFPSVEPPDYLRQLNPEIYEQECQRMRQRFDEAVQLAEQAFLEELQQLVGHLSERLSGQTDGKPKVFRDSAVNNLSEFFQRFRNLKIRSNQQLDQLVEQCQGVVRGVEPQLLRDNQGCGRRWPRSSPRCRPCWMISWSSGHDEIFFAGPARGSCHAISNSRRWPHSLPVRREHCTRAAGASADPTGFPRGT